MLESISQPSTAVNIHFAGPKTGRGVTKPKTGRGGKKKNDKSKGGKTDPKGKKR